MAGPGGGPPRKRYVRSWTTIYIVDTNIQIDILNLAKVVKPVSADTFAVTRTFLSGKLEQLRTSRGREILVQTLTLKQPKLYETQLPLRLHGSAPSRRAYTDS